ncbi:MAG: hypothetical protein OXE94_08955 [Aestuariivita sp.]|nr:hypothetical protein [Aestuariivita sp.]MCY4201131.1 hypothetical protein [Aestuariivita sp.]MCY4287796.1 hypothetical protein [Aestuariivita sp.]MCY4345962.1 hypothetical protein [Aestuariivita sp.]
MKAINTLTPPPKKFRIAMKRLEATLSAVLLETLMVGQVGRVEAAKHYWPRFIRTGGRRQPNQVVGSARHNKLLFT